MYHLLKTLLFSLLLFTMQSSFAQRVTSVWKGKINKTKVEVKIVQRGDLLTGTAYYYESPRVYKRYSIQGYFDQEDNSVVWWDDQLIEEKGNFMFKKADEALKSVADFNCPGGNKMYLTGKSVVMDDPSDEKGPVELTNVQDPVFHDEWDFVIENYTVGANDPYIIDSVALVAFRPPTEDRREEDIVIAKPPKKGMVSIPFPEEKREEVKEEPKKEPKADPVPQIKEEPKPEPKKEVKADPVPEKKEEIKTEEKPVPAPTIEEKFVTRKKVVTSEITVEGEFIELRFYDNAQVDGDSISLFLNDKLLFKHIRLTEKAYTIRIPVAELNETNELTMVAENLGSIPPNTSYMVAECNGKRFEAKLASTENSSAVIILRKPK